MIHKYSNSKKYKNLPFNALKGQGNPTNLGTGITNKYKNNKEKIKKNYTLL